VDVVMQSVLGFTIENKIVRWHFITANGIKLKADRIYKRLCNAV